MDTLWRCVALDDECSDDCLNWFLNQAKSKDHHALCLETFKHIFLEKVSIYLCTFRHFFVLGCFDEYRTCRNFSEDLNFCIISKVF